MAKEHKKVEPAAITDGLTAIVKDGVKLFAHPDQVAAWVAQGWTVAE